MTNKEGVASRKLALEILIKIDSEGAYANLSLSAAFKRKTLSEKDRAFVTALVQGVVRNQLQIDEQIQKLVKHKLDKMPASLRNVLRLGVFQLTQMPNIKSSAVINTAVELAKKTGHVGQAKLVNGVLRSLSRQIEGDTVETKTTSHCLPNWLIDKWTKQWGQKETEQLTHFFQEVPLLTLRTSTLSITAEGLKNILEGKGIECRQGQLVPDCIVIENRKSIRGPVTKLPGYSEGLFAVQDEPAAFVGIVADPKPGNLVIDLCAAPGGKSAHLGELMENKGKVIAIDSHENRLNLLKQTRNRLGLTNIEVLAADGRTYKTEQLADCVLVDAPCSGTGVINRRSDITLKRMPPDMVALVELQKQLLDNAANLVKPNGVLIYSTCSIEPEENEDVIQWFLNTHTNYQAEPLSPYLSKELSSQWSQIDADFQPDNGWLKLMPSRHGVSGFFVARLRRIN